MNHTTKKFPRTLNEAFGPYAEGPIYDPEESKLDEDSVVFVLSGAALIILIVALLAGWI